VSAATLVRDLAAFSIQVALIVLAVAVLMKLVHIPARVRYHGLRLALVAALAVPWVLRSVETPRAATAVGQPFSEALSTPVEGDLVRPSSVEPSAATSQPRIDVPWLSVLLGILGLGVVGRGLWLGIGLVRLRRMTKAGRVLEEPEYAELQAQIGARATITQVFGLAQPATFGVRRPVVMLPDALPTAPASLRRAVIIHELFHVRRRDWLFVVAEELVRTALWFHPAILWLTSHIQLAREEIVDELTVRATGDRRGYVQALLSFADSGGLRPAPAFAHRRQLFHRILGVSKEKVMSRPRFVASTVALLTVVAAASWSASALFPIVRASSVTLPSPTSLIGVQNASLAAPVSLLAEDRFRRPAPARSRAALLEQQTNADVTPRQVTPENPIPRRTRGAVPAWPASYAGRQFHVLAQTLVTLDRNGAVIAVDRGGCQIVERPAAGDRDEAVCDAFSDAAAAAVRQWRYERPVQAPLQFLVVVKFEPGSEPTISRSSSEWLRYVRETQESLRELSDRQGLADGSAEFLRAELSELINEYRELERAHRLATERDLPGHPDLERLRLQLEMMEQDLAALKERLGATTNVASQQQSASEDLARARRVYEQVQAQLREAERRLVDATRRLTAGDGQPEPMVTADVRPDQFGGSSPLRAPSGRTPVRVGNGVQAPRVIRNVKPEYSTEAMEARVEGTVRLQALVDEQGRVADARVLNSIPLLDGQALAAARQWEFTPGLLNGQPVPVLIVMELHFTLR
jgi:TonB family protein